MTIGKNDGILSSRSRVLLVCVTSFVGVVGVLAGLGLPFGPAVLITGVLIQPRFRHLGRGLICFGAIVTSAIVLDIGILTLIEMHTLDHPVGLMLIAVSIIATIFCDWVVLMEEIRIRRNQKADLAHGL